MEALERDLAAMRAAANQYVAGAAVGAWATAALGSVGSMPAVMPAVCAAAPPKVMDDEREGEPLEPAVARRMARYEDTILRLRKDCAASSQAVAAMQDQLDSSRQASTAALRLLGGIGKAYCQSTDVLTKAPFPHYRAEGTGFGGQSWPPHRSGAGCPATGLAGQWGPAPSGVAAGSPVTLGTPLGSPAPRSSRLPHRSGRPPHGHGAPTWPPVPLAAGAPCWAPGLPSDGSWLRQRLVAAPLSAPWPLEARGPPHVFNGAWPGCAAW